MSYIRTDWQRIYEQQKKDNGLLRVRVIELERQVDALKLELKLQQKDRKL